MVHVSRMLVALMVGAAAPVHAAGGLLGGGGLGGLGGLAGRPGILQGPLNTVERTTGVATGTVSATLDNVRRDTVGRPTQAGVLGRDEHGAAIVKDEVLAVSPNAASMAIARRLNFSVLRQEPLAALGIAVVTLRAPAGMSAIQALAALRRADPDGMYDYAHVYNPSGDSAVPAGPANTRGPDARNIRIGMIDGGVQTHHAVFAGAAIVAQNFASESPSAPSQHGTAVASLLVGKARRFSGYLPGANLYAADVFGGIPTGGTAADIARALNWLAANQVAVTNISLTGPDNLLLAAAVRAFVGGGHVLVAPVGNDGAAAPRNYPAAYAGVVGVTSVDTGGRLELDANRGAVRFAALGVDVRVANLPHGYAKVTGTSYAAPAVAARFALLVHTPDPNAMRSALEQLTHQAARLPACSCSYLAPPSGTLTAALQ